MTRTAEHTTHSDVLGFFGAIATHVSDPVTAFTETAALIAQAVGCKPKEVWPFLDSRHGRLFADDVAIELATGRDLGTAIGSTIERWQGWKMAGRGRIARDGSFLAGTVQVECHAYRQLSNASLHLKMSSKR